MANNTIQHLRTSVAGRQPNTTVSTNTQYIPAGAFALNMTDQILYTSDGTNLITVGANQVNLNSNTINSNVYMSGVYGSVAGGALVNSSFFGLGNSTVYNVSNSVLDIWVGGGTNVTINSSAIFMGNSTVNSTINTTAITGSYTWSTPQIFNANLQVTAIKANGAIGSAGQYLTANGTSTYWSSPGAVSVNTQATYTWSNTHTFQKSITLADGSQFASANFSYRNIITNGGFWIDQKYDAPNGAYQVVSYSAITSNLTFLADRWYLYSTTNYSVAIGTTRALSTNTQIQNMYSITTNAASTSNVVMGQRIEANASYQFINTNTTLSWWVSSNSVTSCAWATYYCSNGADNWSAGSNAFVQARTLISSGSVTINSTMQRFQVPVSVPLAATTGLEVEFSVSSLGANGGINYGGVQWEAGSVATPFEVPPKSLVLHECQRFLAAWRDNGSGNTAISAVGYITNSSAALIPLNTNVPLRSTNTSLWTIPNISNFIASGLGVPSNITISPYSSASTIYLLITCSGASGTTDNPSFLRTSAVVNFLIQSELL